MASKTLADSSTGVKVIDNDIKTSSTKAVLALFPDMCLDYLEEKSKQFSYDYDGIINYILDETENGIPYPRRQVLKRKRRQSQDAESASGQAIGKERDHLLEEDRAVQRFSDDHRHKRKKSNDYIRLAQTLFRQSFRHITEKHANLVLAEHGNCLLPAILDQDALPAEKDPKWMHFLPKRTMTRVIPKYTAKQIDHTIQTSAPHDKGILEEYRTAMTIRQLRKDKRNAEKQRQQEEAENFNQAVKDGTAKECECCYGKFAMNRMIHCDGTQLHWFCKECPRRMAESQIGLSKYALPCISMDGCKGGFSLEQRQMFLDAKTTAALERLEQEHILRIAGIEDLETCPFCPFAAEYPPVEINKEFCCQNPDCEEVSCRLCRKRTHIPKTCVEAERESGPCARRAIEEAMSRALIRKCNKCATPFIKENGCNKMTCYRPGCSNVQCYVCHKSCDYTHFDDIRRGGAEGNCPLFESVETRHANEVRAAEEAARQDAIMENPDLDVSQLSIVVSDKVLADEKRRKDNETVQP